MTDLDRLEAALKPDVSEMDLRDFRAVALRLTQLQLALAEAIAALKEMP